MKRKAKESIKEQTKKVKKSINNDSNHIEDDNEEKKNNKKHEKGKYEKPLAKLNKSGKKNVTLKKAEKTQASNSSIPMEKPDWMEFKKKKKELKEKRKAKRLTNIYDISVKAKKISEKLRRSDCSQQDRKKLTLKVHSLLETHYNKMIFTHDMSRIIQWIIRYSDADTRQTIVNELNPCMVEIIQSKYARNCVKTILKYATPKIRSAIVSMCYGNVVKLLSHSVSAPLLDKIYATWASDVEKIYLKQEFYGDMYKQAKDKNIKALPDVYKTAADMKSATLSAVKGNLLRILNKKLINSTFVQYVLWEFLTECSTEDKNEMIVMLRSSIVELSQTKTGTKIATTCIWNGNNKDRKIIMKAVKDNVKTISMSEHGYLVLLALLDSVDDTVLMKKIILSEVQKSLTEIALNEYGKHVILYLVARRDSHYFPPTIIKYLQSGDGNAVSKKPADVREKELLDSIIESFLESVATNVALWMSTSSVAMVTLAILKVGSGEALKHAFNSISTFITSPESIVKEADVEYKAVEHPGLHMMLKKLIQNDKEILQNAGCTFGEVLIPHLSTEVIESWIEFNRGCFLLIFLLENECETSRNTLSKKLKPLSSVLILKSTPGAKILLNNLNKIQ